MKNTTVWRAGDLVRGPMSGVGLVLSADNPLNVIVLWSSSRVTGGPHVYSFSRRAYPGIEKVSQ